MYCVIQKVPVKKVSCGEAREIIVTEFNWTTNGVQHTRYGYCKGGGYFERPNKVAYRISVHRSYRENGKVRKKQTAICTIGYYNIIDWGGWYHDYINGSLLKNKLDILGMSEEELDNMVCAKMNPIIDQIREEFRRTEEYTAIEEHRRILDTYNQSAAGFAKRYECDRSEYEEVYDVFGTLRNPERLKQIKEQYQYKKEYERRSREQSRSYYEKYFNNYTGSGYGVIKSSNYKDSDKEMLKQFYRTLSKKYHPDANPDKDTSSEMRLLNRLKDDWGGCNYYAVMGDSHRIRNNGARVGIYCLSF